MATIKTFEDIISWQRARALNTIIGAIIDSEKFKKSYKLISQIEGSAGSVWIISQKALNEVAIKNLFSSFIYQRVHAANSDRNYIEHLTETTLPKMNSMFFTVWQKILLF